MHDLIMHADTLSSEFGQGVQLPDALRQERDFISAVLDTAGALVVVLDRAGRIVRFNRACERTTGYSLDQVRGRLLWELLLIPEEADSVKAVFEELRAGQFPNEYENHWLTKNGERRLIAWSNTALLGADGAVEYVIGNGIDITDRRQVEKALRTARDELELRILERTAELQRVNASLQRQIAERRRVEDALRESEGHMRSLMESARSYAVYRVVLDPSNPFLGRVILASPSMKDLLSIEDLYDFNTWFDGIHPDDVARIVETNRCSLETGVPFDQQFRVGRGQGEYAWVHVRSTPVVDDQGKLTHFNGLVVDITEQKRAEESLRESEAKFRGIVEYANIGIAIVQDARFRFVNRHYASMMGYTVEELLGTEFMRYCTPDERDRIVGFYTRRARGEPAPPRYQTAMVHKNGGHVYADVSAGIIPYGGQQATFVFLRDITEERQAKQALEEAFRTLEQRVEERTGELAALNMVSGVVSRSLELNEIMSSALDKTMEVTQMEMGAAYRALFDDDSNDPRLVAFKLVTCRGISEELVRAVGEIPLRNSAMEQAADLGRPYVWRVSDVPPHAGLAEMFEREGLHVAISIPLTAKGRLVGGMNIGTRQSKDVTSETLSLLAAIGQQVGMAAENARLYRAEQDRREESEGRQRVAEGMREILAVLNSRQSLPDTLEFIASQTCRLLGSDAAAILRLEDDLLRIQAACGLDADYCAGVALRLGEGGAGRALTEHRPVIFSDLAEAARLTPGPEKPPEPQESLIERLFQTYQAILSVPLVVHGSDYGAITLYYPGPREFSGEDLDLAMAVADQVALAIENARLREQAEQAAALAERSRLARELHDSVTQSLYSVTMYTEAAARLMTAGNEADAAGYLRDARDTAQEALREMRLLIYELRPLALESGGLAAALQARLDAVERRGGMYAELIIKGQDHLSAAMQAELYQIAQEALNNALKHAHAREVHVHLHFDDAATLLEVKDDGIGFDLVAAQTGGGLGLPGMRERVFKIGGRLSIDSAPGRGTRVIVEVPTGGRG
jgi:PAS domain S-box-containing protein